MKTKVSIALFAGIALFFLALLPAPARGAAELIPFYTPPPGGVAYILGAGMISVSNKYMTDTKMIHEAATGTMDIVRRMIARDAAKKDAFGVFGSVDAYRAFKGEGEYGGKPFTTLRQLVYVNGTDLYLVVPAKSSIKSYADVKGKRIGMGGPGSTVANTAQFILDQAGVQKKDFKPYYYTYRESVEGIQDGSLDGGFLAGGYPVAAYTEISSRDAVRIVPVDDKILKKIVTDHPYYYEATIKAKSYKGLEQDTKVLGFTTSVCATTTVSTEFVYRWMKNLFDHKADYYAIHTSAKDMSPETALRGRSIPLHPGAEKYYKEVGILK
jgi:TRAP transporter TAXI family solute receptor